MRKCRPKIPINQSYFPSSIPCVLCQMQWEHHQDESIKKCTIPPSGEYMRILPWGGGGGVWMATIRAFCSRWTHFTSAVAVTHEPSLLLLRKLLQNVTHRSVCVLRQWPSNENEIVIVSWARNGFFSGAKHMRRRCGWNIHLHSRTSAVCVCVWNYFAICN